MVIVGCQFGVRRVVRKSKRMIAVLHSILSKQIATLYSNCRKINVILLKKNIKQNQLVIIFIKITESMLRVHKIIVVLGKQRGKVRLLSTSIIFIVISS